MILYVKSELWKLVLGLCVLIQTCNPSTYEVVSEVETVTCYVMHLEAILYSGNPVSIPEIP